MEKSLSKIGKVKEIEQVAAPAKSAATENWDDDFEDSTTRHPDAGR
jgi:hypothetical protein